MFFILKFTISFVASFLILSIPIGKVTVFENLNKLTSPYTSKVFGIISKNSQEIVDVTRDASNKIFDNTKPSITDQVKEKASSVSREAENLTEDLIEDYTTEERQLLESVLKRGQPL